MTALTALEKRLYNTHLAVSRSVKGKPFKLKKQFNDLEGTEKHRYLKRLGNLITKHPEIDIELYFKAPYNLYPDVEYFGLDYFSSLRAIKAYTMYKKILFMQSPDTQLEDVKKSMKFIAMFCIENKLQLHMYPFHKTGELYTWMVHYKQNKINIYAIMGFRDVYSAVTQLAVDAQHFYIREFIENFKDLYTKYKTSTVLRPYVEKAQNILGNFINQELTNTQTA